MQWRGPFVYFVQQGMAGPIKIGCSSEPLVRMLQLQTAHAERLRLLYFEMGDRERERELHQRFADARISGEWFYPYAPLLQYIKTWVMVERHEDSPLMWPEVVL